MSNIIKAHQYISLSDKVVIDSVQGKNDKPLNEEEHEKGISQSIQKELEEANRILSHAQEQAQEILKKAQAEAERVTHETKHHIEAWWEERRQEDVQTTKEAWDEGYRQGFIQGQAHGLDNVMEEHRDILNQANSILEDAWNAREEFLQTAEPKLLELSIEIARKILCEELLINREACFSMVKQALTRLQEVEKIQICVSTNDYSFLKDRKEELQKFVDGQSEIVILPDHTINIGGCIIRTSYGTVDARIDTQLEEIKKGLMEICREKSS